MRMMLDPGFWSDPDFEDTEDFKAMYLYLYLSSNQDTTMHGCYKFNKRRCMLDTRMTKDELKEAFGVLVKLNKVKYDSVKGWLWIVGLFKHNRRAIKKSNQCEGVFETLREIKRQGFPFYQYFIDKYQYLIDELSIKYQLSIDKVSMFIDHDKGKIREGYDKGKIKIKRGEGDYEKGKCPMFDKMLDVDNPNFVPMKLIKWMEIKRDHHKQYDLKTMVDWICDKAENSAGGRMEAFAYIMGCITKNSFRLKPGKAGASKMSDYQNKKARIGRLYDKGEISKEECQKQMAELSE